MLNFLFKKDGTFVGAMDFKAAQEASRIGGYVINRNDFTDFEHAQRIAAEVTKASGELYLPTDSGPGCYPRFDVIRAPKVGDPVSYAFNGDSYPCGTITKVSKTLQRIETSEGDTFYRKGVKGAWVKSGSCFCLVRGHFTTRNPEF